MVQPVPDVSDIWQRELPFAQITVKDLSDIFSVRARTSSTSTPASSSFSITHTDAIRPALSIHPSTSHSSPTESGTVPLSLPQAALLPGRITTLPPSPTKGSRRRRVTTLANRSKLASIENDSSLSPAQVPRKGQGKLGKVVNGAAKVKGTKSILGRSNGATSPPVSPASNPDLPSLGRVLSGSTSPVLSTDHRSTGSCVALATAAEISELSSPNGHVPSVIGPQDDAEPVHADTDARVCEPNAERIAGSVADKAISIGTYTDEAWEEHGAARDITHDEGPELDLGMVVRGASLGVDAYTVEPVPIQPREAKRPIKRDQLLGRLRNANDAWLEATWALGEGKLIHSRPVTPTGSPYKRSRQ